MKKILLTITMIILVLSGCGANSQDDNTIKVITTVKPVTDIATHIGSEYASVESIYPENTDPHSYELTSQDMKKIADADMFIYTSKANASFIHYLEESGEYDTQFIDISEDPLFKDNVSSYLYGVSEHDHEHESEEADHEEADHEEEISLVDPHIWLSPNKMLLINDVIENAFIEFDNEHKPEYQARHDEAETEIKNLDKELQSAADNQTKPVVLAHAAYGYWEDDYGFEIVSLYGIHHDDEPTSADIKETIDLINEEDINVIYAEQNDQSNKVIKQLSEETGAEIKTLNNLSTVSSDQSGNTVEIMNENIDALKENND